jgi:RNA polymerase sigma-70 factor (ECF subfamily)
MAPKNGPREVPNRLWAFLMADPQADWNGIVETHGARVLAIAVRIVGSLHDAEDVAQDVFVEAYGLYRNKRVESWAGLLVRLATLRAIDRLRRERASEPLADAERASAAGPFEEAVAGELAERLRRAVGRLPQQQAAVFTLVCFEHLARDEVAASLGISPQAVSSALYKARGRLMSELSVYERGNQP